MSAAIRLARPPAILAAAGVLAAAVVGVLLANKVSYGLAGVVGLAYLPVVLLDLAAGIALWGALVFFTGIVSGATSAVELLIAIAWIGALAGRRRTSVSALREHRGTVAMLGLLMVWMALSLLWANHAAATTSELRPWLIVAGAFVVVITSIDNVRALQWVVIALVLAAAAAIGLALLRNGLAQVTTNTGLGSTPDPTRLEAVANGDDPNYLAAVVVAALALAGALIASTRNIYFRWLLVGAVAVMALGLAATQSRGGLVSAVVMIIAAFVVFPAYRSRMLLGLIPLLAIMGAFFASDPSAAQRVTTFTSGGDGRSELWTLAGRMFETHPITGVGLGNFEADSQTYIREPGNLARIDETLTSAQLVHNEYLQLLAEIGIVGLLLYLAVLIASIRASWKAAHVFDRLRLSRLALLSRALLVGQLGLLASTFFLSNGDDRRVWLLMALGPAILTTARKMASRAAEAPGQVPGPDLLGWSSTQ